MVKERQDYQLYDRMVAFHVERQATWPVSLAEFRCTLGGVPAEVLYAGPQGGAGLDQINLRIPLSLRGRGLVDVKLSVDGQLANTVTVGIR